MSSKIVSISLAEAELQSLSEGGWRVRGYATKFNNINSYGFKINAGAYSELLQSGIKPKMFFNHESFGVPIGVWEKLEENAVGLKVEGVLTQGVSLASDVHAALQAGTVDGLSVSISWMDEDQEVDEKGVMSLARIRRLDEISIVTFPSDSKARVTQALSVDEVDDAIEGIQTVRDLETFFKTTGFSKRQSGWLLSKAKAAFAADTKRDVSPEAQKELAAIMARISAGLTTHS